MTLSIRFPAAGAFRAALAAFLLALLAAGSAHAATYTWTGQGLLGSQDFLWSNPFNWLGAAAPTAGESGVALVFPEGNAPRNTTNDIVGLTVSTILVEGANYRLYGRPSGNALTLHGTSLLGFGITVTGANAMIAPSCPLVLDNSGGIIVASGVTLTVAAVLSGPGGFIKFGPGTLLLQAGLPNTFSGTTTVFDGALHLNQAVLFPSTTAVVALPGPVVIGGDNFDYTPVVQLLRPGQIGDQSAVTVNENGKLFLNTHDDAIGSLTLRGGLVNTGAGALATNPGLLSLNGNVTNLNTLVKNFATISGRLDLGPFTRVFEIETASELAINAAISGSPILHAGLTKTGGGLLRLFGTTNTYTGPTTIQEGGVRVIGGAPLLGDASAGTTVASAAQLQLENYHGGLEPLSLQGENLTPLFYEGSNTWAGPITLMGDCRVRGRINPEEETDELVCSGPIGGSGLLRKSSQSVLRLAGGEPNTFTGGLVAEEGKIYFNKSSTVSALGGPLVIGRDNQPSFGALLVVRSPHQIPNQLPVTVLNSGVLNVEAAAPETVDDIGLAGGMIASEQGALLLSGNLTNRVGLQHSTIYGRVSLTANPHVFDGEQGSTLDVHGVLDGAGGIIKTGSNISLTFLNTNQYAGETWVRRGTLNLREAGRPGSAAAGTFVEPYAVLGLWSISVTNESLTLLSTNNQTAGLLNAGTGRWKGPITCVGDSPIFVISPSHLTLDGAIGGSGGLRYTGEYTHTDDGTLVLEGSGDNTMAGPLAVEAGTLILRKSGRAVAGDLIVGASASNAVPALARCESADQFTPASGPELETREVRVHANGHLQLNGFDQQIANLRLFDGWVTTGSGELKLQGDLIAEDGPGGASYLQGHLRLLSPVPATHDWVVQENGALWLTAQVTETGDGTIFKKGPGPLLLIGDNSFHSYLTISEGALYAGGANPLGLTAHPTTVEAGATLGTSLAACSETLYLSGSGFEENGALQVIGTNAFHAPIFVDGETVIQVGSNAVAQVNGAIGGAGTLVKTGIGRLRLAGTDNNTYSGATLVRAGVLELDKTNAVAVPHALDAADRFGEELRLVRWFGSDQVADGGDVTLDDFAIANLNGFQEEIGSLAGGGQFALGAGALTTGGNGASTSYHGVMTGQGALTKSGDGTMALQGNNTYTGLTTVKAGTLLVFGEQPQSDVSLLTGGQLGGTGRVGDVNALNGHLSPGASPGALACADYATFSPDNLLRIEIEGETPGADHDQLDVHGTVLLMGGGLQITMKAVGAVSNEYVIVKNDGVDPVTGTFTGLPEGATVMGGSVAFALTYAGGDGNDIALVQQQAGSGAKMSGIQKLLDGSIQWSAQGLPETLYRIEAAPNLLPPVEWRVIGSAMTDANGQMMFVDPEASQYAMRFYRFFLP